MIFRTEIRNAVRYESEIDEDKIVDEINDVLSRYYFLDKEDFNSHPQVNIDFIMKVLDEKEIEETFIYTQDSFISDWYAYLLEDVVRRLINDYFCEVHREMVDCGDLVFVEYERGDY